MTTTLDRLRAATDVDSTADIRAALSGALRGDTRDQAVAYFDGPGGTQVPQARGRRRGRLSAAPQRQHPLALSHQRGDRRADRRRTRGRVADFLGAAPDEIVFGANMTTLTFHLGRALGPRLGRRATRSSSPSSTTTPTSRRGGRWRASGA